MRNLFVTLLLFPAFVFPTTTIAQDEGPSKDIPELRVLSNYVGTWDVVAGPKDDPVAKGQATAKWILDGRFVQGTGSVTTADGSNDFKVTTLMTYDVATKTYRMWSFFSYGLTSESEATWDAATQTMTQKTRYGDITQTTTSNFSEAGIEKFKLVATDQNNNVVSEMSGTKTHRKDSP